MSEKKKSLGSMSIIGMLFGVVISSSTGEWWWVGVGLALGLAIDAGRSRNSSP